MKVQVLVAQSCPTLCNPMDCQPPDSSVHGIFQARILEWDAFSFSRLFSQPKDQTRVSGIAGGFFYPLSHQGSQKYIIISVQFSHSVMFNSL